MSNRACKTCEFWEDLKLPSQDAGECRRGLPVLGAGPMPPSADYERPIFLNVGIWPVTSSSKWCGLHEPRELEKMQPDASQTKDSKKITATLNFEVRDDGGLRVTSPDIPGLVLSGAPHRRDDVFDDIGYALRMLLERNHNFPGHDDAAQKDSKRTEEGGQG